MQVNASHLGDSTFFNCNHFANAACSKYHGRYVNRSSFSQESKWKNRGVTKAIAGAKSDSANRANASNRSMRTCELSNRRSTRPREGGDPPPHPSNSRASPQTAQERPPPIQRGHPHTSHTVLKTRSTPAQAATASIRPKRPRLQNPTGRFRQLTGHRSSSGLSLLKILLRTDR